jgi:general secretion pathway protein I
MKRSGGRAASDTGSVFVEAVIAAAIVAMALGATFRVIADTAQRGRAVDIRRAALLIAQSRMAAVGSEIPLRPGESAGLSGDMVWRVEVEPWSEADGTSAAGPLLRVNVSVRPREGGAALAGLSTLRLGSAER